MNQEKKVGTINIIIAALGGEGGGVLADWIQQVAIRENWICQSTSLAGVAQRTGATIYYLELFPRSECNDQTPVMALFPNQGDIDIAIASEIAEAGRMIQRGFVTPDRTTLIASDHRVYSITEKVALADGSIDPETIQRIAKSSAKNYIHYDILGLAEDQGAIISAPLFGALASTGALPFPKESYEAVITESNREVEVNLLAFQASYNHSRQKEEVSGDEKKPAVEIEDYRLPEGTSLRGKKLLEQVEREFPVAVHKFVYLGLSRLVDYQDFDYANDYLEKLMEILALDNQGNNYNLTNEVARYLALWMCFEDIARVAQLKIRKSRLNNIRSEVNAEANQLIHVTEYFRPQVEEICSYLPPALAEKIMNSSLCRKIITPFTGGKRIRTNTISAYLLLWFIAGLRLRRRKSWIYAHEQDLINRWLTAVKKAAGEDYAMALELVECARLIKGYGDTRRRGRYQLSTILEQYEQLSGQARERIISLRKAALMDDDGTAFNQAMEN